MWDQALRVNFLTHLETPFLESTQDVEARRVVGHAPVGDLAQGAQTPHAQPILGVDLADADARRYDLVRLGHLDPANEGTVGKESISRWRNCKVE
jgi:hypothetical protein